LSPKAEAGHRPDGSTPPGPLEPEWIPFSAGHEAKWDAFVEGHPGGRFVHLSGYKRAVELVYGFDPVYRLCLDGPNIRAVFPGFVHRSRIYGRKIVSQPFNEYGGLLAAEDAGPGEKNALVESFTRAIRREMKAFGCRHLEMRHPLSLEDDVAGPFQALPLFRRVDRILEPPDILWKKLDAKDRSLIRKAASFNLEFAERPGFRPLEEEFYPIYLKTMKRLGTPPHPLSFFFALRRYLKDNMKLFIIAHKGHPVSALIAWQTGTTVQITDMCSDDAAFAMKPNDFAVWEFFRWAHAAGCHDFDFGPVRYRGQEIFKKKWRMQFHEYRYLYLDDGAPGVRPPRNPFSGNSYLAGHAVEVWKKAVPQWLARSLGARFRKEIGL
jgi:hypothetical protein